MTEVEAVTSRDRQVAVIGSALWAAAGDALGWITELGDEGTVRHRTGSSSVSRTVEWRRRIGGKFGPTVRLPAGTYSDDTQLRLAVGRATGPTGVFDAEAFAKIELPVWSSYSLGAGRGTSAAAANLAKTSVSWFNNFFGQADGRNYFVAGGNGAAMRIQPHVWKSDPSRPDTFLPDVLRDSVITHGAPKGIGGAVFHSLCVAYALNEGRAPELDVWRNFIQHLEYCEAIIKSDDKLGLFWLKAWESKARRSLSDAFKEEITQAQQAIGKVAEFADNPARYEDVLQALGCLDEATRGAGIGTALAAAVVAKYVEKVGEEDALLIAANALHSDTDTIASMAGAIFGCFASIDMTWDIQDKDYIASEARRIAALSKGQKVPSFHYPDLLSWTPPTTQSDGVGLLDGRLFMAGLGGLKEIGEEYEANDAVWQWASLPFGQTVLTKRRRKPRLLSAADAPLVPVPAKQTSQRSPTPSPFPKSRQPDFFAGGQSSLVTGGNVGGRRVVEPDLEKLDLDALTALVIESGFSAALIGRIVLALASRENGVEVTIAFSAIVAKALRLRRKRV
ncbi:ADP-ribosylglycohydrolase family protein [Ensifer sp. ENS05]|uniref:ADP-ribosylglycohydrolase family protein n=1 Tax=Ensifer sp. ENS05 TaxID=2769277 RepID=UPI00178693EE|nr:ADP-ribosylglycohydrolase family protein [Ensifer sp. ENS05]MBD9596945.1 ADP-ribosylglycohydrolase family protein [Ensifer sp. ENS05]